jgi:hypothetical protein
MACQLVTTRGAVFALWGKPEPADMEQVTIAMEAAAEACGHPVVYVTRVPVDAPPPDAPARARLNELMPRLVRACSTYHVVLEGEGFGAAVKRGILTGIFQLSWRRKTFFVHATASEVTRAVGSECRKAVHELLTAAERRGLLPAPRVRLAPPL